MYASIRKYRTDPDRMREIAHRVDEIFAPRLEALAGFVAYQVVDCGGGRLDSLTICRDRESCERSVELAAEFVRDELADVEIERLSAEMGEVLVSRAIAEVLEPAHA